MSIVLSTAAWISLRHTATTVAFLSCRGLSGGFRIVHWSLVYCESYTMIIPSGSCGASLMPLRPEFLRRQQIASVITCGTADNSAVLLDSCMHPQNVLSAGSSCTGP